MRPKKGQNLGMLWVDRVGNRRSEAILVRNFSEKNGRERKNCFHVRETRDKTHDKKQRRNNAEWKSYTTLINVKVSGMIVTPASLRSDSIHIAGTTIHIALESTIHIAGIRSIMCSSIAAGVLFALSGRELSHIPPKIKQCCSLRFQL
jgi:hypothetical protein